MKHSAVLVLDLGNVVFPLEFEEFDAWLLSCRRHPDLDISSAFLPIYLDYERGKFDSEVFLSKLKAELDLDFDSATFEKKWLSCWKKNMPGMESFLKAEQGQSPLYVLSNTNGLHMNDYLQTKPILQYFDQLFLSYQMDCSKPDPQIYEKVRAKIGCKAEQILFFDDKRENIAAARSTGWQAEVFVDVDDIKKIWQAHLNRWKI